MQPTNSRIAARIDPTVKQLAQDELEKHGLTLSEYVRIVVTSVAFEGLPKHFGLPNETVMASLKEVADSLNGKQPLVEASDIADLERLLNE